MGLSILQAAILMAILLNILASIFLALRNDLDKLQKGAQVLIVWFVPYLGAIGLWLFHKSHDDVFSKRKPFGGGNEGGGNPPGTGSAGGNLGA